MLKGGEYVRAEGVPPGPPEGPPPLDRLPSLLGERREIPHAVAACFCPRTPPHPRH